MLECQPYYPLRNLTGNPDDATFLLRKYPLPYLRSMLSFVESSGGSKIICVFLLLEEERTRVNQPVDGMVGEIQDLLFDNLLAELMIAEYEAMNQQAWNGGGGNGGGPIIALNQNVAADPDLAMGENDPGECLDGGLDR